MALLNNSIMSDHSKIVAYYENFSMNGKISNRIEDGLGIKLDKSYRRTAQWFDFIYREEEFSLLVQSGDILLFADNSKCSKSIIQDLKNLFSPTE